jgi:nitroreductase
MSQPLTSQQIDNNKATLIDALRFRRAIKAFDPGSIIAPEDFDFLAESARLAPSSNGLEPWNIIVLRSPELRTRFVEATGANPRQALDASHLVAFTCKTGAGIDPDGEYLAHIGTTVHGMDQEAVAAKRDSFRYFLAHAIRVAGSEDALYGYTARQAYLALENMLIAAALIRIDSCALEGLDYAAADRVLSEAGLIDRTQDRFAVGAVFGYRAQEPHRPQARRPIKEAVRFA